MTRPLSLSLFVWLLIVSAGCDGVTVLVTVSGGDDGPQSCTLDVRSQPECTFDDVDFAPVVVTLKNVRVDEIELALYPEDAEPRSGWEPLAPGYGADPLVPVSPDASLTVVLGEDPGQVAERASIALIAETLTRSGRYETFLRLNPD